MKAMYQCCCGLDVHKKQVVACLKKVQPSGEIHQEVRRYPTMTGDLRQMSEWLREQGCTHVAMESTGVYWRPIYNILEGGFELLVVNAQHLKAVPGRKTDVKDAQWIAQLLLYGLLKGSFVPGREQRELRELTRYRRSLVEERARVANRLQKSLESANIKLASVVSDVLGISAREMLEALVRGDSDPAAMAQLARGKMRKKIPELEQALTGEVTDHTRFLVVEQLRHVDSLDELVLSVSAEISKRMLRYAEQVRHLDTIHGVNQRTAEELIAEVGAGMGRFQSASRLASWAAIGPGNHESAGKRYSGRTRKGSPWLRSTLIEAAHGASHSKNTYLSAQYHRIAARRGKKRALVAVAHTILRVVYYMLLRGEDYRDLGSNYFDERGRQAAADRLLRRLEKLGYEVALKSPAQPASAPRAA